MVNIASLLAGSEGTLAVIQRAKINLVVKPKRTILGVLAYNNISDACDDVPRLLEFNPSAIELIPRMIIQLARGIPACARQMGWLRAERSRSDDPAAVLVIEFSGDRPEVLKEAVLRLRSGRIPLLTIAESAEEQSRVWNVRKMGLGILDSRPQSARPAAFIEDCAIPVERLGGFIREVERILAAHHVEGGIYAHASAGCLHIRPILDLQRGEGVRALRTIGEQVLALTLRLGGSMSSEHGDGIASGEWIEKTYGVEVTDAMRKLKRAADPQNLLNPKKMFDAPPMDTHLRYGENYRAQAWTSVLDFSRNGGLKTAIEQCNGQGVCRKDTGVMCPSFQATRDEQNSTRGRANLLRALIARPRTVDDGRSTVYGLRSDIAEQTYTALDLCLACKGCKSECPSGVDMAKLKFAFMNEYFKSHRRPLRDYVFGYFHVAAHLLSSVAPLTNLAMQNSLLKSIAAKALGITSQRPFPKFTRERARVSRIANPTYAARQKIIYLSDPFSKYIEPKVEQAAFDILNTLGFEVHVLPVVSAGAALLSKGFLAEARVHAGRVLDALNKIDPESSMPILGIEPPEIYSLKHDYLDLWPERKDEISKRVKNVWLLEEYVIRSAALNGLRAASSQEERKKLTGLKIKFHPHCHQRAEGPADDGIPSGTGATVELLRACGYEVELIEAGCCGMAGTFGYEAEHYELSMKVGELKLFSTIREWREENGETEIENQDSEIVNRKSKIVNQVVSSGAACRMQIEQGAGVEAIHPLEMVRDALDGLKVDDAEPLM